MAEPTLPPLTAYMQADTPEARSAAFLRLYAMKIRDNTELTWDIPNTRAATLEDIATRVEAQAAQGAALAAENARLKKELAITTLAVPIEEELSERIEDTCKHLATEQGFTLQGIARLLVDVQRRMTVDWQEVGRLRADLQQAREQLDPAWVELANAGYEHPTLVASVRDALMTCGRRIATLTADRDGLQRRWDEMRAWLENRMSDSADEWLPAFEAALTMLDHFGEGVVDDNRP